MFHLVDKNNIAGLVTRENLTKFIQTGILNDMNICNTYWASFSPFSSPVFLPFFSFLLNKCFISTHLNEFINTNSLLFSIDFHCTHMTKFFRTTNTTNTEYNDFTVNKYVRMRAALPLYFPNRNFFSDSLTSSGMSHTLTLSGDCYDRQRN